MHLLAKPYLQMCQPFLLQWALVPNWHLLERVFHERHQLVEYYNCIFFCNHDLIASTDLLCPDLYVHWCENICLGPKISLIHKLLKDLMIDPQYL